MTTQNTALTMTYNPETVEETVLSGQRELYVTLQGIRELNVTLQGGAMTAENQNLTLYAGESRIITIPAVEEDGVTPMDISGATIKWMLKRTLKSATNVLYKDTTDGITITDAVNGKFNFVITKEETQPLSGYYYHVAISIDANGNESVLTKGTVTVNPLMT